MMMTAALGVMIYKNKAKATSQFSPLNSTMGIADITARMTIGGNFVLTWKKVASFCPA